jgi:hypothetical protein
MNNLGQTSGRTGSSSGERLLFHLSPEFQASEGCCGAQGGLQGGAAELLSQAQVPKWVRRSLLAHDAIPADGLPGEIVPTGETVSRNYVTGRESMYIEQWVWAQDKRLW